MLSEADSRKKGRSLLKDSRSARLEVPKGAYTFITCSIPSVAAMARPDGMLERLVTTVVSRVRMAVPRRDVPIL